MPQQPFHPSLPCTGRLHVVSSRSKAQPDGGSPSVSLADPSQMVPPIESTGHNCQSLKISVSRESGDTHRRGTETSRVADGHNPGEKPGDATRGGRVERCAIRTVGAREQRMAALDGLPVIGAAKRREIQFALVDGGQARDNRGTNRGTMSRSPKFVRDILRENG